MAKPWNYGGTFYANGSSASERAQEAKKHRALGREVKWVKNANTGPKVSVVVKGNAEYRLMYRKKAKK